MKHAINPHKLLTSLIEGESSYSDGRHSFRYELLLQALKGFDLAVDSDAVYVEGQRRSAIAYARRQAQQSTPTGYRFTVDYDPEPHYSAVIASYDDPGPLPYSVRTRELGDGLVVFECGTRKFAAETWRYVRKFYPVATITFEFPRV
jgi:hypothetical protein